MFDALLYYSNKFLGTKFHHVYLEVFTRFPATVNLMRYRTS